MRIDALYREGRERLVELGSTLSDESAAAAERACPGWAVRDVYAHLSGIVAAALAGRMEGVTTDPWTQRQVDELAAPARTRSPR